MLIVSAAFTGIANAREVVRPAASLTDAVKFTVAADIAVPETVPDELRLKGALRPVADQVYGAVPPEAVSCAE